MDFYITKTETMYLGKDELSKLSFNGGFKEYVLSITATIARERHCNLDEVEVKSISWTKPVSANDPYGLCFKVEYDCTRHFDTEEIVNAFCDFLKKNGASCNYVHFECGDNAKIDIDVNLPRNKMAIILYPGGKEEFCDAIKSTVPYLDFVKVHCNFHYI